jgi:hypothetical protein
VNITANSGHPLAANYNENSSMENKMTLTYALTRGEIVRFFLLGLRRSPRLLGTVVIYSAILGLVYPATSGALFRQLSLRNGIAYLAGVIGAFCFMILLIFVRGKTGVRTLNVSEAGITTEIGSLKGSAPWNTIAVVDDVGRYILIARSNGNAFFIPSRAFTGPEEQAHFHAQACGWWKAARENPNAPGKLQ